MAAINGHSFAISISSSSITENTNISRTPAVVFVNANDHDHMEIIESGKGNEKQRYEDKWLITYNFQ